MNSFRGKILVIRGGAIGDFILTLPAITALRRQFPDCCLEVLGYPHIVKLAIAGGVVDNVRSIEARSLAGFFARGGQLAQELAVYFSDFDLIISYLYDPDDIFRTNVGLCSPAQFIAGPHRPEPGSSLHASKVYLKPLERLAIFEADPVPRLRIGGPRRIGGSFALNPVEDREAGTPHPVLAAHPGSGSESKNWPEGRWAQLLERLVAETGLSLLLVGGEAEGDRLQRLAAALPPARTRVARSLPLTELAAWLAGCDGFLGHDSGISHLAAAVGLPGLLLWGESEEQVWRPPSEKVTILRYRGGLSRLPADTVLDVIRTLWGEPLVRRKTFENERS